MWVRLRTIKRVSIRGSVRTYYPGDCVEVGKHDARRWIADGDAVPLDPKRYAGLIPPDSGIAIIGPSQGQWEVPTRSVERPCLLHSRTLIWHSGAKLKTELLPIGFGLLDVWQVACPLYDYDVLAEDVGTAKERKQTEKVVRDLRVPLYDDRLVFVRRSPQTEAFVEVWNEELGGDSKLALLRAVYRCKPLILPLPVTWMGPDPYTD